MRDKNSVLRAICGVPTNIQASAASHNFKTAPTTTGQNNCMLCDRTIDHEKTRIALDRISDNLQLASAALLSTPTCKNS